MVPMVYQYRSVKPLVPTVMPVVPLALPMVPLVKLPMVPLGNPEQSQSWLSTVFTNDTIGTSGITNGTIGRTLNDIGIPLVPLVEP